MRTATEKADSYDPAKNGGRDIPKPDEADVRRATRDAQHAKAREAAAQRNVDTAQSALDAAKKLAAQAKGLREEAARRTVTKLREASDAGIPNRHWWEEIGDWVSDHWDEIVTVCKWVVTVVGIIVMIVGGPLGWLVFAAALVVMADTIRKVIEGQAGWGDLLWAALDCIPATKGFTSLAKLGKLWKAGGLRALGTGLMGDIGGGLKGLANGIRNGSANVVSMVKGLASRGNKPLSFKVQPFKDGRPGMLVFKPGDPLLKSMNRIKNNGTFDVGIHGSPTSVGYQIKDGPAHLSENWHNFNHREIASLIRAHGWNGETVRLLSCQTGMKADGFAQNLANSLGVKVTPNDYLWVWPQRQNGRGTVRRQRNLHAPQASRRFRNLLPQRRSIIHGQGTRTAPHWRTSNGSRVPSGHSARGAVRPSRQLPGRGRADSLLPGNHADPFSDSPDMHVRVGIMTDGEWVWHLAWSDYVKYHRVSPPDDFLEHITALDYTAPDITVEHAMEIAEAEGIPMPD
ncbi:hypothetical protein SFUMM280S_05883 [Streptomyces fumanus]